VKTSQLWDHVALMRYKRVASVDESQVAEQVASAGRAFAAARTAELTEHWIKTGWHSSSAANVEHPGRGWHDAASPSKLLP
jgi:hypothetical protein